MKTGRLIEIEEIVHPEVPDPPASLPESTPQTSPERVPDGVPTPA